MKGLFLAPFLVLSVSRFAAQDAKEGVISSLDLMESEYAAVARQIWQFAEVGFQEYESSALLQSMLKEAGFAIETGVAGMPTAFVASYGHGKPVVGFMAEFDALPGMSQQVTAQRKPVVEGKPGHACGHNLLGTASAAAAIAVQEWLAENRHPGTVRLYGTPAEEDGAGKAYLVREGWFKDVDAVLDWHPGTVNQAWAVRTLAAIRGKFRFYGIAAHASGSAHLGRSSLDAVEAMNHMVDMMREHVPPETKIHYVITHGGGAPNIVPEFAEVFYFARNRDIEVLQGVWARIVKASEGAALGTETRVENEVYSANYSVLPNDYLSRLLHTNFQQVGGLTYTPEEQSFAERIIRTFNGGKANLAAVAEVQPYAGEVKGSGSTDVGDVSWVVPTARIMTATFVPGSTAHSWQNVAAAGMSIGVKGMMVAAKVLALTAVDLYTNPTHLQTAREELEEARGPDFVYKSLLGGRDPPLDPKADRQKERGL